MRYELLPPESEQRWLLDQMAALLRGSGIEPLLCAPVLAPSDRFFPDRWTPDADGVRRLARRLLHYASLDLDAAIGLYVPEEKTDPFEHLGGRIERSHRGAAAWYAGTQDGVSHFAADARQLEDPSSIVGVLCHEVAHAWRDAHHLMVEERDAEERLTDLTTIYLGFGILTTNATYRYHSSGQIHGNSASTEWSHQRLGYLSTEAMSFLLAVQAMLCDIPERTVAAWLEPTQRAAFREAFGQLDPDQLIEDLGLPDPAEWPPVRELVVEPME